MKCTVCKHPRSHDIELAMLSGNYTLSELKQLFGPSRSAFHRHQKHLQQKISRAEAQLENNVRMAHLFKLNSLLEEASDTVRISREDGNSRLRLQAVNTSARLIQAMDKMSVGLDRQTVYRLMTSPQGPQSDCFLPVDSHILVDNFQALALSFKFPCPEAEPRELTDPEDRPDALADCQGVENNPADEGGEDDLAAAPQLSPKDTRELADFLAQAGLLPDPPDAPPAPPVPETTARRQRDKSGTEAGQTAPPAKDNLENQQVKQGAEKPGTTPASHGAQAPPPVPVLHPRESLFHRLRRKLAPIPAPATPHSCDSDQLYEQYLQEKAAALAAVAPSPVSDGAQAPPPVPLCSLGENPALPQTTNHCITAPAPPPVPPDSRAEIASLETENYKPQTGNHEPEPDVAPKPKDRFAGYFKFPGDYPPGYLFAVTHGYWPDDPPETIPDRRWEEDFLPASRFGKTKGAY